jgi:hypothetical protein
LTPKQWDDVKDKLNDVILDNQIRGGRYYLDNTNWNVNTTNKITND